MDSDGNEHEIKGKFIDGQNSNDAVYTTGNVGIGVNNPGYKLDVGGEIKSTEGLVLDYGVVNGHTKGIRIGPYLELGNTNTGRYPYISSNAHMVEGIHPNPIKYAPTYDQGSGIVMTTSAGTGRVTFRTIK